MPQPIQLKDHERDARLVRNRAIVGAVFVLLLRGLGVPSWPALMAALLVAAGQTFVLSRFWAFRR